LTVKTWKVGKWERIESHEEIEWGLVKPHVSHSIQLSLEGGLWRSVGNLQLPENEMIDYWWI
jgi:hypothetical protein